MAVLVRAERRTQTEKVLGWLLAAAAAEFALLAVTGVYLIFFYRPTAARIFASTGSEGAGVRIARDVQILHRLMSDAMVLTVVAVAGIGVTLSVARSLRTRNHGVTAAAAVSIAVVGLFASFTGFLLPWDQIALSAVTIGTNMSGLRPMFLHTSNVQAVFVGSAVVSLKTYRFWTVVHVLAVPVVLVALGLLVAHRLFGRQDGPDRHTGLGS